MNAVRQVIESLSSEHNLRLSENQMRRIVESVKRKRESRASFDPYGRPAPGRSRQVLSDGVTVEAKPARPDVARLGRTIKTSFGSGIVVDAKQVTERSASGVKSYVIYKVKGLTANSNLPAFPGYIHEQHVIESVRSKSRRRREDSGFRSIVVNGEKFSVWQSGNKVYVAAAIESKLKAASAVSALKSDGYQVTMDAVKGGGSPAFYNVEGVKDINAALVESVRQYEARRRPRRSEADSLGAKEKGRLLEILKSKPGLDAMALYEEYHRQYGKSIDWVTYSNFLDGLEQEMSVKESKRRSGQNRRREAKRRDAILSTSKSIANRLRRLCEAKGIKASPSQLRASARRIQRRIATRRRREAQELAGMSDAEWEELKNAAIDWQYLTIQQGGTARKSDLDAWLMSRFDLTSGAARAVSNAIEGERPFSISGGRVRWRSHRPEPQIGQYPGLRGGEARGSGEAIDSMGQVADPQPGNYYVSVVDGGQHVLALGPFVNDHQAALDQVDRVKALVEERDPRGHWYGYGTARSSSSRPGKLNAELGFVPARKSEAAGTKQSWNWKELATKIETEEPMLLISVTDRGMDHATGKPALSPTPAELQKWVEYYYWDTPITTDWVQLAKHFGHRGESIRIIPDQERDDLRDLQDKVIALAERLGYDQDLQTSAEYPGSPTIRQLRPRLWPQWEAAIRRAYSYLSNEDRQQSSESLDNTIDASSRKSEAEMQKKQTANGKIQTWEYRFGNSVVIANKDEASKYFSWRLYVNDGQTATQIQGQAKTMPGMERQIARAAKTHSETRGSEASSRKDLFVMADGPYSDVQPPDFDEHLVWYVGVYNESNDDWENSPDTCFSREEASRSGARLAQKLNLEFVDEAGWA